MTRYDWHLECSACGTRGEPEGLPTVCPACGQPWLVRYPGRRLGLTSHRARGHRRAHAQRELAVGNALDASLRGEHQHDVGLLRAGLQAQAAAGDVDEHGVAEAPTAVAHREHAVGTVGIRGRIGRHVVVEPVRRRAPIDFDQRTDDPRDASGGGHADAKSVARRGQIEFPPDGNHGKAAAQQEAVADVGVAACSHAIEHARHPVAAVDDVDEGDAVGAARITRLQDVDVSRELDQAGRIARRFV